MNKVNLEKLLNNEIIHDIVEHFLKALKKNPMAERKDNPRIKLSNKYKCFRRVFEPNFIGDEEKAQSYLVQAYKEGLIELRLNDNKTHRSLRERNVTVVFNSEYEEVCREILGIENLKSLWEKSLGNSSLSSSLKDILVNSKPIEIENRTFEEILDRIYEYEKRGRVGDYIRMASGDIFWGMSKVLDHRVELCNALNLVQAPILISVYSEKEHFKKVFFIENKQTFHFVQKNVNFKDALIIYLSGFTGTAKRLRQEEFRDIYIKTSSYANYGILLNNIEAFFYQLNEYPIFFWGDLDYEGINIYLALKNMFPKVKLWKRGYELMKTKIDNEEGHSIVESSKEGQKKPKGVDDDYINFLVQSMNIKGFYDQEGILL